MQQVVDFVFEKFNVVLFALDVDVMDPENQQRVRKVMELQLSCLCSSVSCITIYMNSTALQMRNLRGMVQMAGAGFPAPKGACN